ncbi:hypothetical protein O181_025230 [Austropuccinia psidii MF-1]|uniref:Uncharacterized protein n=1 Tax=Austropuccinia psidii MF-1 TaxID=1389203 RepID=A0A9Q3H0X6_9BASI|nr:hypothetical protein [Austropuccinia psidii MF-1]
MVEGGSSGEESQWKAQGKQYWWMSKDLVQSPTIDARFALVPAVLEKGWNPRLCQDCLRKNLVELHPTAASFKGNMDKARKNAGRCMEDSFAYAKDKWDKLHATQDFKVGD